MSETRVISVVSPLSGKINDLERVPKAKYSTGMMGRGLAIVPSDGKVISPGSGEIVQAFPTKHAVTILLENTNVEIMIHVGTDTEALQGRGFNLHVKERDKVKRGDLLISFDINYINENLNNTESPVVVINPNEIDEFQFTNNEQAVKNETSLMELTLSANNSN